MKKTLLLTVLLFASAVLEAQVIVHAVPAPDPSTDSNIILYNQSFDRPNNKSGWIYDPASTVSGPYRDLGQTFTPSQPFSLNKLCIAISPYTTQENLDACSGAPFHLDVYRFASINEMEPPADTLSSQAGHLPVGMTLAGAQYLEFDLQDIPLSSATIYGFLLKFDSLKVKRMLEVVKSEDSDFYTGGKMLYTEFNGSDGRQNITVYKWKHAGGNAFRDLHFWLIKGSNSGVNVNSDGTLPNKIAILQNYPNPFNASTVIQIELPQHARVSLAICNLLGKSVIELKEDEMAAGVHQISWNGCDAKGQSAPSGIYYLRLQSGDYSAIRKLTLLR
jgi:hypothetical protein